MSSNSALVQDAEEVAAVIGKPPAEFKAPSFHELEAWVNDANISQAEHDDRLREYYTNLGPQLWKEISVNDGQDSIIQHEDTWGDVFRTAGQEGVQEMLRAEKAGANPHLAAPIAFGRSALALIGNSIYHAAGQIAGETGEEAVKTLFDPGVQMLLMELGGPLAAGFRGGAEAVIPLARQVKLNNQTFNKLESVKEKLFKSTADTELLRSKTIKQTFADRNFSGDISAADEAIDIYDGVKARPVQVEEPQKIVPIEEFLDAHQRYTAAQDKYLEARRVLNDTNKKDRTEAQRADIKETRKAAQKELRAVQKLLPDVSAEAREAFGLDVLPGLVPSEVAVNTRAGTTLANEQAQFLRDTLELTKAQASKWFTLAEERWNKNLDRLWGTVAESKIEERHLSAARAEVEAMPQSRLLLMRDNSPDLTLEEVAMVYGKAMGFETEAAARKFLMSQPKYETYLRRNTELHAERLARAEQPWSTKPINIRDILEGALKEHLPDLNIDDLRASVKAAVGSVKVKEIDAIGKLRRHGMNRNLEPVTRAGQTAETASLSLLEKTAQRFAKLLEVEEHFETEALLGKFNKVMARYVDDAPRKDRDGTLRQAMRELLTENLVGRVTPLAEVLDDAEAILNDRGLSLQPLRDAILATRGRAVEKWTVDQLRAVHEALEELDAVSKTLAGENAIAAARATQIAVEELTVQGGLFGAQFHPDYAPTLAGKFRQATADASHRVLTTIESISRWIDRLDRFDRNGPWNRYFLRPLVEAAGKAEKLSREYAPKVRAATEKWNLSGSAITPKWWSTDFGKFDRSVLIDLLGHSGNAENLGRVAKTFKWLDARGLPDIALTRSRIRALDTEGLLASVQKYSDEVLRPLFEEHQQVQIRLSGTATKPIDLQAGEWYWPISVAKDGMDIVDWKNVNVAAGFAKPRTSTSKAVVFDANNALRETKTRIHAVSHTEAITSINALLRNKDLRQNLSLNKLDWLHQALVQQRDYTVSAPARWTEEQRAFMRMLNVMNNTMTTAAVAFKMGTMLKHGTTALFTSTRESGPKAFLQAAGQNIVHGLHAANEQYSILPRIFSKDPLSLDDLRLLDASYELPSRHAPLGQNLQHSMTIARGESFSKWIDRYGYLGTWGIAGLDRMSAVPEYLAAARKALAEGREAGMAGDALYDFARYAGDRAVQRAHGSGSPIAVGKLQIGLGVRGDVFLRTLTPFTRFVSAVTSSIVDDYFRAHPESGHFNIRPLLIAGGQLTVIVGMEELARSLLTSGEHKQESTPHMLARSFGFYHAAEDRDISLLGGIAHPLIGGGRLVTSQLPIVGMVYGRLAEEGEHQPLFMQPVSSAGRIKRAAGKHGNTWADVAETTLYEVYRNIIGTGPEQFYNKITTGSTRGK